MLHLGLALSYAGLSETGSGPGCDQMNVTGTIDAILNQKSGDVWSVEPDATVYEAVAKMAEKNVGALVVMEGDVLVGIVSERDYTRKVMLRGKRSRETQVSE